MLCHRQRLVRRGVVLAEYGLLFPLLALLALGLIVAGVGVFRYQQVASLSRDAARWVSVRGAMYWQETGNAPATAADVEAYVRSRSSGLDPDQLTVTTTWNESNWPARGDPSSNPPGKPIRNTVRVRVEYLWIPEWFFGGIRLRSTSEMPMEY